MLLAAPYLLAASICTNLIAEGGPGWFNLLVILFVWNALKFLIIGPASLVLLTHAAVREAAVRHACPASAESGWPGELASASR